MFGQLDASKSSDVCAFGPYRGTDSRLSDSDIRRALAVAIGSPLFARPDLIVEEVECLRGYVRADYLCFRAGELSVIEIKSDKDSLSRFDEQVRVYSSLADRVTLIVGWNLAARALRQAPWWWQVLLAERADNEATRFVPLRDGAQNPDVDATTLLATLPVADLQVLGAHVGVHDASSTQQLRDLIALRASNDDLRSAVRRWLSRISIDRLQSQADEQV